MANQEDQQVVIDDTQEPQGNSVPKEPQGSNTDWKAEARKWEDRAKRNLEEVNLLKDKAAKYDQLEDAKKSDIERANEAANKAQEEAASWQSKYEELQAQRQHELDVRKAASEYGVDAEVLMRMGGNVKENAEFLKAKEANRQKFGNMRDGGEQGQITESIEEKLSKAKSQQERIRIRAEFNAQKRINKN